LYTGLIKSNSWSALADSTPQSNNVAYRNNSNQNVISELEVNDHNNEVTPAPVETNQQGISPIALPPRIWKYLKPANLDQKITFKGMTYYYCNKCICKKRRTKGLYNMTHPTSKHYGSSPTTTEDNINSSASTTTQTNDNEANLSLIDKKPAASILKKVSSNSSVQPSTLVESNNQSESMNDTISKTEEEDLNEFTFKGAFMSSDDGAWMTSIDDLYYKAHPFMTNLYLLLLLFIPTMK
jgi:hypothetical protein